MLTPLNITCKTEKKTLNDSASRNLSLNDFSKIITSYTTNEDTAVEDGHGDGNLQRFPFADTNIQVWDLARTHITAEEM